MLNKAFLGFGRRLRRTLGRQARGTRGLNALNGGFYVECLNHPLKFSNVLNGAPFDKAQGERSKRIRSW